MVHEVIQRSGRYSCNLQDLLCVLWKGIWEHVVRASHDTLGKRCSCSGGRAGTPQHKATKASVGTVGSMLRAGLCVQVRWWQQWW